LTGDQLYLVIRKTGAEGFAETSVQLTNKTYNLTDTIINLETVNPIEFFGVNNGKLDLLKKKFPLLKILSRGTQIKLSGAPEQIETAKEKIDLILQYLERNGHLTENYFEQILGGDDL
jgi:phosphate starvation-inducible PhoH-like protein